MVDRLLLGLIAMLAILGVLVAVSDEPDPVTPRVELETEALLDAATIEMRGYGPDGEPGTFLYLCETPAERKSGDPTLVCTQESKP